MGGDTWRDGKVVMMQMVEDVQDEGSRGTGCVGRDVRIHKGVEGQRVELLRVEDSVVAVKIAGDALVDTKDEDVEKVEDMHHTASHRGIGSSRYDSAVGLGRDGNEFPVAVELQMQMQMSHLNARQGDQMKELRYVRAVADAVGQAQGRGYAEAVVDELL